MRTIRLFGVGLRFHVKSLTLSDCNAGDRWPPVQAGPLAGLVGLPGGTRALSALLRVPAVARSRLGLGGMFHDKSLLTRERLEQLLAPVAASRERRLRLKRFFRSFAPAELSGLSHLLEQLEVPTMVIWGADNQYASPSWGQQLCDAIPGARRLELIPFAGISCHEERPDHFARLLEGLWNEVGGERAGPEPGTGEPAESAPPAPARRAVEYQTVPS